MEYGLIGKKLGHSFSKEIHEKIGKYSYELIELDENEFIDFMEKKDFKAINVTIPYKEKVMKFLDYISDEAKKIGAVNTIVNKDGKLYGYNTDYYGLKEKLVVGSVTNMYSIVEKMRIDLCLETFNFNILCKNFLVMDLFR